MALLEKLEPGSVYLVKISASNQAGDGPFSITVELPVLRGKTHPGKNPRNTYSQTKTTGTRRLSVRICLILFIKKYFLKLLYGWLLLSYADVLLLTIHKCNLENVLM